MNDFLNGRVIGTAFDKTLDDFEFRLRKGLWDQYKTLVRFEPEFGMLLVPQSLFHLHHFFLDFLLALIIKILQPKQKFPQVL